ncbi:MAG: LysE family translocator, partial [Dongiaceae bacterium]
FILAFLPQFVAPAKGNVAGQILFLGLLFNIGGTTVNIIVTQSIATAGRFVKASPRFGRLMRRLSALVFFGLALRLALSERT